MKTRLTSLFVVTAALSACVATAAPAASKANPAAVYRVANVYPSNNSPVRPGSSRHEVLSRMGRPDREIAPDFWIYTGYHADDCSPADRDGCAAILVIFREDKVSALKLANKRAIEIYAASANARQRDLIASGK